MATAIERTTSLLAQDAVQRGMAAGGNASTPVGIQTGISPPLVGGISPTIFADITGNSKFFFTLDHPAGTPGQVSPTDVVPSGAGGSFRIQSTSLNDTSTYYYQILPN
jgi:hypothetical protein